jgi:UDP:flavonoid glycosyltransferase YjiC (YdhE family)
VEKNLTKLVEPTLEAYKNTDTLVIVTTGYNGTAELRTRYKADNVIIEDYIPFGEVMPKVDVYVTNGGYGGTLLSIQHNLPMVAAGVHEGKNEICARVGYFKLGVNLGTETPTVQQIREAVDSVLGDGSYTQNLDRVGKDISSYDAYALCVQHIQELLN